MAIDPNIVLGIKTPEFNPAQTIGQIYALKGQKQDIQMNNQKLQEGNVRIQQLQQQQADDAATRSALTSATSVDPNTGVPTLNRNQALSVLYREAPAAAMGLQKNWQLEDLAKMKQTLDNQKTDLENKKAHVDLVGQLANGVTDEASYQATRTYALQHNLVSPDEMPPQYDPNLVKRAQMNALTAKDMLDQQAKKLDQDHASLELARQVAADADQSTYRKSELAQGQQRIKIEQQNANTSSGQLGLAKQKANMDNNAAVEAQAQQIASGDVKPPSIARNNPYTKAIMARVYELNPKYSDSLYQATQDLRSSKPNSMGGNVGRLGTAILHADEALKNSKDLGFSEGLLTGVSTSGTSAYKQSAEFLTGEIGQYVTGGKLTVDEGKKLSGDLMSSRQGVRDSALHEIIKLSKGKLQSQMQSYKNATQQDFPTDRVFNDEGIKSALQNHGVISSGGASGGSGGAFNWDAHPVVK